jgi:hypothetical protein
MSMPEAVKPLPDADTCVTDHWDDFESSIPSFSALTAEQWKGLETSMPNSKKRSNVHGSSGIKQRTMSGVSPEKVTTGKGLPSLDQESGGRNEIREKILLPEDDYNEDSIQIFREELDPRFDWRLAEEWAQKYKRNASWILRGIMACRECCVSPKWFLNRYLKRIQDEPRREDVEAVHRRLLEEDRITRESVVSKDLGAL